MRVKTLSFDDDGMPDGGAFFITGAEMLYLAQLTGRQTGTTAEQVMPGGSTANSDIFDCLSGSVFNAFYEDGADEAARARRVTLPPASTCGGRDPVHKGTCPFSKGHPGPCFDADDPEVDA